MLARSDARRPSVGATRALAWAASSGSSWSAERHREPDVSPSSRAYHMQHALLDLIGTSACALAVCAATARAPPCPSEDAEHVAAAALPDTAARRHVTHSAPRRCDPPWDPRSIKGSDARSEDGKWMNSRFFPRQCASACRAAAAAGARGALADGRDLAIVLIPRRASTKPSRAAPAWRGQSTISLHRFGAQSAANFCPKITFLAFPKGAPSRGG
jgi:hypothetical protein